MGFWCSAEYSVWGSPTGAASESEGLPVGSDQKHVLLVEDSEDDREVYSHFLSINGFRVSTAVNGRDCLEKQFELQPDLVLLDPWLPEMSGWEASQHLRSDERTRHIPVVVITGHSYIQADKRAYDGFLTKPCLPNNLAADIWRVPNTHDPNASKPQERNAAQIAGASIAQASGRPS